jgi:putative protein-disulfide isomerase
MPTLIYVHDPMCSWCWGFAPVFDRLLSDLPDGVKVRRILGGLASDSDVPMPHSVREYVQGQWRRIQREIPGTEFNFDFWTRCSPRRSTYPACRAVIAARQQGAESDPIMTRAIQRAYYLEARNPSDPGTLADLAGTMGLDAGEFARDLASAETDRTLRAEIAEVRALGIRGFPSLVLERGRMRWMVPVHYTDHRPMRDEIARRAR